MGLAGCIDMSLVLSVLIDFVVHKLSAITAVHTADNALL